jgi:hypothetical protein
MPESMGQITERLYHDFHPHVTLHEIIALVHHCRDEVGNAPAEQVPELVERLARQRLSESPQERGKDAASNGL